jgi:hypothetical protein
MKVNITRLDGSPSFFSCKNRVKGALRSSLHKEAVGIIEEIWPMCSYYEELKVPIKRGRVLRFDIFVPRFDLFVEVHGEQHVKFNSHFYKDRQEFREALKRDAQKREFCELNNFKLVELYYNQRDQWKNLLLEA